MGHSLTREIRENQIHAEINSKPKESDFEGPSDFSPREIFPFKLCDSAILNILAHIGLFDAMFYFAHLIQGIVRFAKMLRNHVICKQVDMSASGVATTDEFSEMILMAFQPTPLLLFKDHVASFSYHFYAQKALFKDLQLTTSNFGMKMTLPHPFRIFMKFVHFGDAICPIYPLVDFVLLRPAVSYQSGLIYQYTTFALANILTISATKKDHHYHHLFIGRGPPICCRPPPC